MKKILLLTGVLCLASVGGVSAYLTDYDKVSNQFTVGKVDVELTEDNWKPDDHKKIEPGKVISKDPRIKNTGINDAYAYLEVSIPTANVIAAADNGSRLEKRVQELFSFQSKASWTKLNSQKVGNNQVYVFAYNKILKPQETTESLFDTVKFLNIIEVFKYQTTFIACFYFFYIIFETFQRCKRSLKDHNSISCQTN